MQPNHNLGHVFKLPKLPRASQQRLLLQDEADHQHQTERKSKSWFVRFTPLMPSRTSICAGVAVASSSFVLLDRASQAAANASTSAGHVFVELAAASAEMASGQVAARAVRITGGVVTHAGGAALQRTSTVGSVALAASLGIATVVMFSTAEAAISYAPAIFRSACSAVERVPNVVRAVVRTVRAVPDVADTVRHLLLSHSQTPRPLCLTNCEQDWVVLDDALGVCQQQHQNDNDRFASVEGGAEETEETEETGETERTEGVNVE